MAISIDKKLLNEDGSIPNKLLTNCISIHIKEVESRLNLLDAYYNGEHNILSRTFTNPDIPNNKIVCNHAEYISDLAVGYVFGVPISYSGEGIEELIKSFTDIDEDSHNNELALDISVFGRSYELVYMSDEEIPTIQLASLSPLNTFLVVDSTVAEKPLFAVHYYSNYNLDGMLEDYTVEVYRETYKITYKYKVLENSEPIETGELEEHFFKGVPLIEYSNNKKSKGDFEGVVSLIDAYNKLQSDRVNDKEQLVDAFLVLIGQSLGDTSEEATKTAKYLMENKIIELDADGDAKWLVKQLNETEVEVLKKSLKDDIHEFSKTPCLTDENFVGNASGVAMKYKLLGFEQLGKTKERYFKKGLRQRLKLISNVESTRAKIINSSDIDITMKRSLPVDDELLAKIAQETDGFISWETRVKNFNSEIDVEEERKRLDKENKKKVDEQQKAFGSYDFKSTGSGKVDEEAK